MFKVSVMYPSQSDGKFDFDYYRETHMKLVEEAMKPFGLKRTEVEKGMPLSDGKPPLYVCVGHLYFDRADGYDRAIQAAGAKLRADIPNYTNIRPVRQLGEMLD
jgi:uncharacterized protein (TIGR02118 family)